MNKFGNTKLVGNKIYSFGSIRLAPHYYNHILKGISQNKSILDIGCGDGIIGTVVDPGIKYIGLDIGAGSYEEVNRKNIYYIRDYETLLQSIEKNKSDISILVNVLEHTLDFTSLFEKALQNTNEHILVTLPNEENIHLRLNFLFGRGITSHTLDMVGKHVNHRHLWLIQMEKAKEILVKLAESHGFELNGFYQTISFPKTKWKSIIYRLIMKFLPWKLKSRNFALLFKKMR